MSPVAVQAQAGVPSTFSDGKPLPKVLVFDLDYTLWPFWIDTHVTFPMKVQDDGKRAVDRTGETLEFYKDVPAILAAAQEHSIPMALASRTTTPDRAQQLLKMLTVPQAGGPASKAWDLFANRQIYPGDKRTHMKAIHKALGVGFEDMLFFDDEHRNINVEQLGVCFWLVEDGVTAQALDRGVHEWRRRRKAGE